jgi:hypothetical protein
MPPPPPGSELRGQQDRDQLGIEAIRFQKLISQYVSMYPPAARNQITKLIVAWCTEVSSNSTRTKLNSNHRAIVGRTPAPRG